MKMSEIIDNQVIESLGDFSQDILFDSQLFKKIKKADYSITEYSGFNRKLWEKFGLRKNIMYYGLSLKEKALNIEITSNKIEIPLLEKRELVQRISKINEKDRCKIGWIYIGSIQMILSPTFREGIDTLIDLALLDNRIVNKKKAILGIIRGNLKYQKLIFNIYPKIAYNLADKDFDRTLSLIQDFKRQDFMREGNKPYSITYKIVYALTNTHHIEYFAQKDYIDLPLFLTRGSSSTCTSASVTSTLVPLSAVLSRALLGSAWCTPLPFLPTLIHSRRTLLNSQSCLN